MRGSKERKVIIGAVIVTLILVTLFVVLQVPRRVKLLFPTEKTIEQDVKKYLKKRYKQDFHVTNIIPPSYEYASYIITVYPYGKPMDEEHKATVQGWEKDGLIVYYDDYAVVKLIPELKEYISDIVKEEFPENKVYVSFYKEWYDGNVDRNITLKKLLKENEKLWLNSMDVQVNIYDKNINKTEFQNRVRLIVKEMSKRNIIGSSRFYLLYKKQTYDELPMFLNENIDLGVCGKDFIYLDILVDDKKEMYYEYLEDEDRGVNIK